MPASKKQNKIVEKTGGDRAALIIAIDDEIYDKIKFCCLWRQRSGTSLRDADRTDAMNDRVGKRQGQ